MKNTTAGLVELNRVQRTLFDGIFFDLGSVYEQAELLRDRRDPRGVRYPLALLLSLKRLAKLCGADTPSAVADWARQRAPALAQAFQLSRPCMPGHSTYRRMGQQAGLADDVLTLLTRLLLEALSGASRLISLDGKTLRGRWDKRTHSGVHLLAAYLPAEGLVLMQVQVGEKENEIPAAPRLLQTLDIRGHIVMADALHTQRRLSTVVLASGADYIWYAKANQSKLQADIRQLFVPEPAGRGSRPVPNDFQSATQVDSGHGRIERRTLTVSSLLQGYLDWPGVKQVFKLERVVHNSRGQATRSETVYGLTSLSAAEAKPAQLLEWTRAYWGIESGLHQRRDVTLHEDATRMSNTDQAKLLAALNNFVVGLANYLGFDNLAAARRYFAAHIDEAFSLLTRPLKAARYRL
jgi:predicted transposase YbfD/YdcC